MRTPEEMTRLIIDIACADERVRAVWLNGSRANPNAVRDEYMDFDIVYAVTCVEPYRSESWLRRFGEICVMQDPDRYFPDETTDPVRKQAWLMQFVDGARIDLTLLRLDAAMENYGSESQTVLWLDKDERFPPLTASDRDYWLSPPTADAFAGCCNEFHWVSPYPAKGLARCKTNPGEILYARKTFEACVRPQLDRMLCWRVGVEHGFDRSVGKEMKYLPRFLPDAVWTRYLTTFPDARVASVRDALLAACDLFEETAAFVADAFRFEPDRTEARNSRQYIEKLISAFAE